MTDPQQTDDLGRLSFTTAGQLRLLSERMITLSWQPDGYDPADLRRLADALHGMALRCAARWTPATPRCSTSYPAATSTS